MRKNDKKHCYIKISVVFLIDMAILYSLLLVFMFNNKNLFHIKFHNKLIVIEGETISGVVWIRLEDLFSNTQHTIILFLFYIAVENLVTFTIVI